MHFFLFEVDPENAELEAEKDACMLESKIRREENKVDKEESSEEEHDTHDEPEATEPEELPHAEGSDQKLVVAPP